MINLKLQRHLFSKLFLVAAFFLICNLHFVISASAASPRLYFAREGSFGIKLLVDSAVPVNAYDIELAYNAAIADIESADMSRSLVTVTPKPMSVGGGTIIIKGGSMKPFSGEGGEIATFTLKPVAEGILQLAIVKGLAYEANGEGTPLALAPEQFALRVTPDTFTAYEASRVVEAADLDSAPPQIATVSVEENPLQYGERLIVFTAFDAESGVARYEARDRLWLAWSPWREAVNPYPMTPGAWAVQLKAVDYSGNASLATVYQLGNAAWKVALVVVLLGLLMFGLLRLRRRRTSGA